MAAARKLSFMASWVNEQDEAALEVVHEAAEAEWQMHRLALPEGGATNPNGGGRFAAGPESSSLKGGEAVLQDLLSAQARGGSSCIEPNRGRSDHPGCGKPLIVEMD